MKVGSIRRQIDALLGWAIQVKENFDDGVNNRGYWTAEGILKTMNTQGRRLELRKGIGLRGAINLNRMAILKERITQSRAAIKQLLTDVRELIDLEERKTKETDLKPAEVAAIERKEKNLRKRGEKEVAILIKVLKVAKDIVWQDFSFLERAA